MTDNKATRETATAEALAELESWLDPRFSRLPEGVFRPKPLAPLSAKEEANLWTGGLFGGLVDGAPGSTDGEELKKFMANPDPEVLAQMAKSDPALALKLREQKIDEVSEAFAKNTPAYLADDQNYERLLENMVTRLLKRRFSTIEDAEQILAEAGAFTTENLRSSYEILKAAGRLKMAPGASKRLTTKEERQVAAVLTTSGLDKALEQHLSLQFGGERPLGNSARNFLTKYPKETTRAVLFVWENARPDFISSPAWVDFLKRQASRQSSDRNHPGVR